MKVANTVELKNKTNALLRQAMDGTPVIITYRRKSAAALTALREEDLEDFVLEHSPKIRTLLAEAERDRQAGRVVNLDHYLAKRRGLRIKRLRGLSPPLCRCRAPCRTVAPSRVGCRHGRTVDR